jgi:type I restriction enzyme S subunit
LGRRLALIRPDPRKVNTRFLHYLFFSEYWRKTVGARTNIGATVDRIPLTEFPRFEVLVPPLPLQHRIASILSAYDDLIENNLRRIEILEEMAQALYREWFVEFRYPGHEGVDFARSEKNHVPSGWKSVYFTDIAEVLSGGTPKTSKPEFWNGAIPFFSPKDAPASFFVTRTERRLTEEGVENCSSSAYEPETVFITARGTVGKVVLPAVRMAMNQSCYALRGKDGIGQLYLFLAVRDAVEYLRRNTGGATFPTIIVDTFRRMPVQRPPNSLLTGFERAVRPFFDQLRTLLEKNELLRVTRDLLLPRLISGELDVSELDIDVGDAA